MYIKIIEVIVILFFIGCDNNSKNKVKNINFKKSSNYIEAEAGKVIKPMYISKDKHSSGGKYISSNKGGIGAVEYIFDINRSGEYIILARCMAKDNLSDSFFVKIDDGKEAIWDINKHSNTWEWIDIKNRKFNKTISPFLKKGKHILSIRGREDGTKLDALLIKFIKPCINMIEAETGNLLKPMNIYKDNNASSWQYIMSKKGHSGGVLYKFKIETTDDYRIFGKYIANSDISDSFFVKIDKNKEDIWDITKHSNSWKWGEIRFRKNHQNKFFLRNGEHELYIRSREKETKLDKLIITNYQNASINDILEYIRNNNKIGVSNNIKKNNIYYISQNGIGNKCTKNNPCSIYIGFDKVKAGDTLLLRGGIYNIRNFGLSVKNSGTKNNPITIKSYSNELAIIDGGIKNKKNVKGNIVGIAIYSKNYINIKNLEIRGMTGEGISITGSNNLIEGCKIHNNFASGIAINAYDINGRRCSNCNKGFNTIRDNIIYNNSGADIFDKQRYDGDNADGISIASGQNNLIEHNTVYSNSDDGIDTWRSNDSIIRYNRVYNNGEGKQGDGNGIKAGGNTDIKSKDGLRTIIEHNIVYNNRAIGIDYNAGKKVIMKYNTVYNNKSYGFRTANDTIVMYNIAYKNGKYTTVKQNHKFNSWQINVPIEFISINPSSINFLKPKVNAIYNNIGAFSH